MQAREPEQELNLLLDAMSVLNARRLRIAELEALLREVDAKVIFESCVMDGTGNDLQERIEAALGIGR